MAHSTASLCMSLPAEFTSSLSNTATTRQKSPSVKQISTPAASWTSASERRFPADSLPKGLQALPRLSSAPPSTTTIRNNLPRNATKHTCFKFRIGPDYQHVKLFIEEEEHAGIMVQTVHTDGGGEFIKKELQAWARSKSIKERLYSPTAPVSIRGKLLFFTKNNYLPLTYGITIHRVSTNFVTDVRLASVSKVGKLTTRGVASDQNVWDLGTLRWSTQSVARSVVAEENFVISGPKAALLLRLLQRRVQRAMQVKGAARTIWRTSLQVCWLSLLGLTFPESSDIFRHTTR
ncbi:uncharacterized protein NFIA_102560 [Aspergillus fischeri NRRL 181]|uniref:Uncharacterized protein n=1 Tax=Neosartorya fischeri (strain ATCC 1020 / DSM 3700 / CBS 544.65 / FGSC A1164 / JCM 1740 / NRRL 181 / WB 181) TaxID=331117 RepID=A1CVW9_NEOFI|nr:uncharacterized protein NFIA_102560 [Aspergillus fischeri NRRL 181]EAW24771.1 hypothetical protein NFIA_102560 [Aspergillus fischeri NRRL 181]